jgi:hypothetical protein
MFIGGSGDLGAERGKGGARSNRHDVMEVAYGETSCARKERGEECEGQDAATRKIEISNSVLETALLITSHWKRVPTTPQCCLAFPISNCCTSKSRNGVLAHDVRQRAVKEFSTHLDAPAPLIAPRLAQVRGMTCPLSSRFMFHFLLATTDKIYGCTPNLRSLLRYNASITILQDLNMFSGKHNNFS